MTKAAIVALDASETSSLGLRTTTIEDLEDMMGEPTEDRLALAQRLKLARQQAGLSQSQVAKMLGCHRPAISEMEAARRGVAAEELAQLAEIYDVDVNWLLGKKGDESDPRVELAARELGKLKPEDLDRVLLLLQTLRD